MTSVESTTLDDAPHAGAGAASTSDADERPLHAYAHAAAFASGLSTAIAVLVSFARSGLRSPDLLAPLCVTILVAAAFAPFLLPQPWQAVLARHRFGLPLATLCVLFSPIAAVSLSLGPLGLAIYPPLAFIGMSRFKGCGPFVHKTTKGARSRQAVARR